jgi:hypothetical protein
LVTAYCIGHSRAKGKDNTSSISPSPLTALTERAALQNNEVPPEERSAESAMALSDGSIV